MNNSESWNMIYDTSDFGNKYPSSYLLSLFHARIKPLLLSQKSPITDINVLDFGCSIGANSKIFRDLGINTYGIDVSESAIHRLCLKDGDEKHFKAANLLDSSTSLQNIFPNIRFDFVVASEVMYYFTNKERALIIEKIADAMNNEGLIYISMPTYDFPLYKEYKSVPKDKDGMVTIQESGRIKNKLLVNLPRNKEEMIAMFNPLKVIDLITVNTPLYSEEQMTEYHLLAQK